MANHRPRVWDKFKYLKPTEKIANAHTQITEESRSWEAIYKRRWQHDKVVRSTHGVNCTGSCSWDIYVKDGIVTWEGQALNYPTTGPDMPEYEPRGCPRGASFSWYIYSPLRVKYPYVRKVLLDLWREAKKAHAYPLDAWKSIVEDPEKAKSYKQARGKGGLVRADWQESKEMIAASMLYTSLTYGPDRNAGFSPIPAMSMVSHAAGARFMNLMGGPMLSFYDWYADLPPASPQIWGDQTDVPESADWFNSSYIMTWGSNVPLTRTPDAHFLAETRYKGTKVVSVSPDYAESTKFSDSWLSVKQGTDGALAMAMGHVILKEFYHDRKTPYFEHYAREYTDLPFLLTLRETDQGLTPDRYLHATDVGMETGHDEWKPLVYNTLTGDFAAPKGTMGTRWEDKAKWTLEMVDETTGEEIDPTLSFIDGNDDVKEIILPNFTDETETVNYRAVPVKAVEREGETVYVTTVFDVMMANYGVDRGLGSQAAKDLSDVHPYTPAWQEAVTGVPKEQVIQIAREFAQNAIDTNGRSMIIMGAGINHWYNSDTIYRTVINLILLVGAQGVNGGGWAHYVGQEKLRPAEGWQTVMSGKDWQGPPRLQNGTSFYYFATDQWRYEDQGMEELASPTGGGARYNHPADYNVMAARLGWLPSYPTFNRNGMHLYEEAVAEGHSDPAAIGSYIADQLMKKKLQFAIEDPDDPVNFPRNLFVWRANLVSSSGKGHEYFLKHLLGTTHGLLGDDSESLRPEEITWRDEAPEGKLDLLINLEFRMSGTALYSDIVLPTATWYEKSDLSSTDMHPFVHPFNPAIPPLWESKSDWMIFTSIAKTVSEMAEAHDIESRKEVVATPLLHDTPQELSQPLGQIKDWSKGETEAIPGCTMPQIHVVERDYKNLYAKMTSLGPNVGSQPFGIKGMNWSMEEEYEDIKKRNGTVKEGFAKGCPEMGTDLEVAETILSLASTTNGKVAVKAWEALSKKTGRNYEEIAKEREGDHFTFDQISAQPKTVITSPAFSGSEKDGRRYSPFTMNVEQHIPWRTITGRQSFFLDHDMMHEFGESLATYKPILKHKPFLSGQPNKEGKEITLNFLTPHNKWSIHSMFFDSKPMLNLFRGGPTVWMNLDDAADADIEDNDWIEVYNRNGVVVARAVVSHRLPRGMAFMHHAQDRHIHTPGTDLTKNRGGTHNSPTKIHVKPTHMIGGYGQLSYGFNYYGPTGNQRDINVVIRKMKEVNWYEN
ncbi:nitrate reductase subunit alpha [Salisediminibacterium selenitireducens]|uniref:nitrate reductase (quinone) n=1 Tax=Bacillus selenitireducens (strain ATCC 700615 / DSM 15326 / MLS10) TaxID=439292 RepID=D6XSL8_BACIE|nr:nitrate reductase subunit alpha [Salisediminibacterium selenitireducens]ADH98804.1 nitrate reductase, alpha subunit [[Bacillus] selenitireducens MLS10]